MNPVRNSAVTIRSHLNEVYAFIQDILKLLNSSGVDKSTSFNIRLCLEEALINAIKHGNKGNENLPITIQYSISGNEFKISIEDCGKGFDHKNLDDPTRKENLLKTKGRGVYLIKRLMDVVSFNKTGNIITMVKYLKK